MLATALLRSLYSWKRRLNMRQIADLSLLCLMLWSTSGSAVDLRIKVFPHHRNYQPHGRDHDKSQVAFRASKHCQYFRADPDQVAPVGLPRGSSSRWAFDSKSMKGAAFLKCTGITMVERGKGLTNFSYRGSFYIKKQNQNRLLVINLVSLEDYLKGVVPAESYAKWRMEALKAQAIAARSFAMHHWLMARGRRLWDLDDTIQFQVYTGVKDLSWRTSEAVDRTQDLVLAYKNKVIQAYYHADAGHMIESSRNAFGVHVPYSRVKPEQIKIGHQPTKWTRSIDHRILTSFLRRRKFIPSTDVVLGIEILKRTSGDRVESIGIKTSKGSTILSIGTFRQAAGYKFPSKVFWVKKSDISRRKTYIFGAGRGHGVGLSQVGAAYLAKEWKWPHRKILKHYYQGTKVCRLVVRYPSFAGC